MLSKSLSAAEARATKKLYPTEPIIYIDGKIVGRPANCTLCSANSRWERLSARHKHLISKHLLEYCQELHVEYVLEHEANLVNFSDKSGQQIKENEPGAILNQAPQKMLTLQDIIDNRGYLNPPMFQVQGQDSATNSSRGSETGVMINDIDKSSISNFKREITAEDELNVGEPNFRENLTLDPNNSVVNLLKNSINQQSNKGILPSISTFDSIPSSVPSVPNPVKSINSISNLLKEIKQKSDEQNAVGVSKRGLNNYLVSKASTGDTDNLSMPIVKNESSSTEPKTNKCVNEAISFQKPDLDQIGGSKSELLSNCRKVYQDHCFENNDPNHINCTTLNVKNASVTNAIDKLNRMVKNNSHNQTLSDDSSQNVATVKMNLENLLAQTNSIKTSIAGGTKFCQEQSKGFVHVSPQINYHKSQISIEPPRKRSKKMIPQCIFGCG